jgi:hypothetical protein
MNTSSVADKSKDYTTTISTLEDHAGWKYKMKKLWGKFLFKPTHPFKIKWDLLIIMFSIWNALTLPYSLAFPDIFTNNVGFNVSGRIIDVLFAFDVIMNFRTGYVDAKTDELILNSKKIAINYIKGRCWIDLLATLPLEDIGQLLLGSSGSQKHLKLFSMMKLVRLLRLGRIVTYLKMNSSFKFGMKIIQLLFMLLLILHWFACLWYIVVSMKNEWFPPKDNSLEDTLFYSGSLLY